MPTQAEQAARLLASRGTASPSLFEDIGSYLRVAAYESMASALPGVASVGGVTLEEGSTAVAGLGAWPAVLILLLIITTLRVEEDNILAFAGEIPWAGGRIQSFLRARFRWIDNFENAVIAYMLKTVERLIINVLNAFTLMLGITLPRVAPAIHQVPANHTGYATEAEVRYLQSEIVRLNSAVRYIDTVLDPSLSLTGSGPLPYAPPNTTTHTTEVIKVGVPQSVWDQIHDLQSKVHSHTNSITDLYNKVDRIGNVATSLEHQFGQLQREIHSVRAVSIGWQDVEEEVATLGTLVSQFMDEASAELTKLSNVQTQMNPLTLLLEPGIKGLRNLRKLEDNICQCPKIKNIPNELGTALAVLEFVENG